MDEKPIMIPLVAAESMAMHLGRANRRMLIALLAVCITIILTVIIFVNGYTTREKNRLDTQTQTPAITEAYDAGVHE